MLKKHCQYDVVRYLYHEVPEAELSHCEKQVFGNQASAEEFFSLLEIKDLLDVIQATPSDAAMQSILQYSRNYRAD